MTKLRALRGVRSIAALMLLVAITAVGILGARLYLQRIEVERVSGCPRRDAAWNAEITRQIQTTKAYLARADAERKLWEEQNPGLHEAYKKALEVAKRRRVKPDVDREAPPVFRQLGTWPESP